MKLKTLEITNFRCFESLSMDFDEQLTVLVAKNGAGKTSILDAIRIGLWSFVSGFDLANLSKSSYSIKKDDVRMVKDGESLFENMTYQLPSKITLQASEFDVISSFLRSQTHSWTRSFESTHKLEKTRDDDKAKQLQFSAKQIQAIIGNINKKTNLDLPIFGYYGTGRLGNQKRSRINYGMELYMRLFAYRDCLDPASSYQPFKDWVTWVFECYWDDRFKQDKDSYEKNPVWEETISVIQQAINSVLRIETGWHDLEYSVSDEKSLILNHPDYGKLKVTQLSDGIRNVLAMVGDIAYRCIKLNSHLGIKKAIEGTSGIVMIDEIELHLHPAWQQTVLSGLIKTFPKIQFIVTTHSPQVLSTIHRKSIRLLGKDINGKDIAAMPIGESYGEISSDVLQTVMHVNPQPPIVEKSKLERLTELVDQGLYQTQEAKTLFAELKTALNENHPQLQKLQRSIKRQDLLKA